MFWSRAAGRFVRVKFRHLHLHILPHDVQSLRACGMEFQTFIYFVSKLFVSAIRNAISSSSSDRGWITSTTGTSLLSSRHLPVFLFPRLYGFGKKSPSSGSENAGSRSMVISALLKAKLSWLHSPSPLVSPFAEERPNRY